MMRFVEVCKFLRLF